MSAMIECAAGAPTSPWPRIAYCELHCHTPFTLRGAGSGIEALVARAVALGMPALAITDTMTLGGVVRFHAACAAAGIRPITGCELVVAHEDGAQGTLLALARDRQGYANLCGLLTRANLAQPDAPVVPLADLAAHHAGLVLLAGGCDGRIQHLCAAGHTAQARALLARYLALFGPAALRLELCHPLLPESALVLARTAALAAVCGIGCVASNAVRYATPEDYRVYDLLTCVRLGITLDEPHAARPRNAEQHLKSAAELRPLFAAYPGALEAAADVAATCMVELLASRCVPPRVALPAGHDATSYLRAICRTRLPALYAPGEVRTRAARQLTHELAVIEQLELQEFFLCVYDIMRQAHTLGIRCAGRGSAANSLVAYLLGITAVDPLAHGLLFERFLNVERQGMPDIDVDVQSSRREELIQYVEATYSEAHAAMVANVVTYRLRLAVRDVAKALGFPLAAVDRLARCLPHFGHCGEIARYADDLTRAMAEAEDAPHPRRSTPPPRYAAPHPRRGTPPPRYAAPHPRRSTPPPRYAAPHPRRSTPPPRYAAPHPRRGTPPPLHTVERGMGGEGTAQERLALLLELVPRLMGFPRHLSLHNGGLLLTREPLTACMPVRLSANGVRAVELDKDDVERLGLIKFDLLGLRTFDAIERCLDLIAQTDGARPPVDSLPLDQPDPRAFALIRAGQTLAVFQIESPGQWHLLAHTQPETFDDLVIQTALFRPGPLQANMVHPYIARRQGRARVIYAHPCLEPILRDTRGIVLFQEQVLEIAHAFAGLSYGEADGFRRAMSHYRTAMEMEGMRARFVMGAASQGIAAPLANRVFDEVACFVGYGFCKSHAAAFARTIYQTAWLKAHYPAHYLAACLASQPAGFFPPATVLEEAKLLGIATLPVDIASSAALCGVERIVDGGEASYAIRIGLAQVKRTGEALAQAITDERAAGGPYTSLADFCARLGARVPLRREAVQALVAAGAFDGLGIPRRRLLWLLDEHWRDWQTHPALQQGQRRRAVPTRAACQVALPWAWPAEQPAEAPPLPPLTLEDEVAWDLETQGLSARPHPLTFQRRALAARGAVPIARLTTLAAGRCVLVVGQTIAAQRPPTAKGMAFVVLEDETGRVQVAVPPTLADGLHRLLAESRVLLVAGRLERTRTHCALLARALRALPATRAGMAQRDAQRAPGAAAPLVAVSLDEPPAARPA